MKNDIEMKLEKLFQDADKGSANKAFSLMEAYLKLPEGKRELVERFVSGINK